MRNDVRLFVLLALIAALGCSSTTTNDATPPASSEAAPPATDSMFPPSFTSKIDAAVEQAIADGKIPGGVVHVEQGGKIYERAYGMRSLVPEREPMTRDTIFDMASVTKVAAATPSIMKLVEEGKVDIDAPVSRYIPEFRGGWRDEITVRDIMTHVSGLRPDLSLDTPWKGYQTAIELTMKEEPRTRPGPVFVYSDINFILVGEIVHRVSGEPLDQYVKRHIYEPLGMMESGFNPPTSLLPRIAPTEEVKGEGILHGVVHDPTARRMGGVAGHAGLFTSVSDLCRYARMILNGGELDGVRIFKPETVKLMTSAQSPKGNAVRRGLGWDFDSIYSRPRGNFPVGSFGHTGWTGSFIWIDPASKSFYAFLSNRVHPDGKGSVLQLQLTLGKIVSEQMGYATFPKDVHIDPRRGTGSTQNGIDVVEAHRFRELQGMRIGLVTNHTGRDRYGNPTIDVLRSAPGVDLVALFTPEHGIRGDRDEKVSDSVDPISGLPIHSLYGERREPTPEQLDGLDALVFDVQDVGVRFYTYISTMGLAMDAAAKAGVKFIVLDRINPIDGIDVEGPSTVEKTDFVAFHPIAIRHGMTVGELATMFNEERSTGADLTVVPMRGWKRTMWQSDTGVPWFNTSPNIRSLDEATLYPGIGLLETMALSVGRGTATPFEVLGAPYIDGKTLASELNGSGLGACVRFEPIEYTPESSKFAGEKCGGVRISIVDRSSCNMVDVGITIATILQRLYPNDLQLEKMDRLVRDPAVIDAIRRGASVDEIRALWTDELEKFRARRAKYLIYE